MPLQRLISQVLLGAFFAGGTSPAAQAQFDSYLLLGSRITADISLEGTANGSGAPQRIVLREPLQVPWLVGGVRLAGVVYRSLALEAGYTGALVRVSVDEPGNEGAPLFPGSRAGLVHVLTIRPRIQLGDFGNAISGHAFAGPAVIWRAGAAFREYDGTRRGGWSIGIGATLRTAHLNFRADLEDVIYRLALSRPRVLSTDRMTRHDLMLTVGIALLNPVRPGASPALEW